MAEYIAREAILKHTTSVEVGAFSEWDIVKVEHIKNAPAADVVEVVHGEWIITHDFDDCYEAMRPLGRVVRCSVCGYPTGHVKTNFCPECGADMRGDENGLSPETKQVILDDFMKGVE